MALLSNAQGALVLADAATPSTYSGPPIVVWGTGLAADGDRWVAALAFAESLRTALTNLPAPIIGVSSDSDAAVLTAALARFSRWQRASRVSPPSLLPSDSDERGVATDVPAFCGPILTLPPWPDAESADAASALALATTLARSPAGPPTGIALCAATSSYPHLSPPVYRFGSSSWRAGLPALADLWLRPPAPTEAQHVLKAALVASDPARHRCLHPSLLASTLITA